MDVSNNPLDSTEFLERLRADWAKQCNLMLPEGVRIDTAALRRRASNVSPPSTRPRQPRDHQTRWAQHPQCDQPAHRHGQPVPDGHPQTDGRPDRPARTIQGAGQEGTRHGDEPVPGITVFDRQPIASRGRQLVEAPTPPPRSTSGRSLESKPDPVPREIGREPRRPEPEPVDELDEARRELADLTEWWKTEPPREVRDVQRIIDVAREASEKAEHANPFTRGWLRHAAERTAAEQSQLLKQTAPWLENTTIPATYAEANAFRTNASKATLDHMRKPYEDRVRRLNRSRFNERIKQRLAENIEKAKTTHEPIPQPHHRHSR